MDYTAMQLADLDCFGDDYNSKYNCIKKFASDRNLPLTIIANIVYIKRIVEELKETIYLIELEAITGPHKEMFINHYFPQIVKIMITQMYVLG